MIELDKMSEVELKALAYDNIVAIEQCKANLAAISQRLQSLQQSQPEPDGEGAP